ncbi:MAG: hypothetical protein GY765_07310 [bacterium]|nr:hypothetical protein [bacterium]
MNRVPLKHVPLVLLLVAGTLFFSGCSIRDAIDITGRWVFNTTLAGDTFQEQYTLLGDSLGGDVYFQGQSLGVYTVKGDKIGIRLEYLDSDNDYTVEQYTGSIISAKKMSESVTISVAGFDSVTASWVALR